MLTNRLCSSSNQLSPYLYSPHVWPLTCFISQHWSSKSILKACQSSRQVQSLSLRTLLWKVRSISALWVLFQGFWYLMWLPRVLAWGKDPCGICSTRSLCWRFRSCSFDDGRFEVLDPDCFCFLCCLFLYDFDDFHESRVLIFPWIRD